MAIPSFGAPLLINDKLAEVLRPVPLGVTEIEQWLQDLLFAHPESLPIAEIDNAYVGLMPLCMELDTPAGPIDALYITATGKLVVLETKLWRNPEARRKVIGQILHYAQELSQWDYSRLNLKVGHARREPKFGGIAELICQRDPTIVAHRFQDSVTQCLKRGDFLLLIAGDGIRENVGAITEYLDRHGTLHFTFGLIECAIYETANGARLVQPRVLATTTNIVRTVIVRGNEQLVELESQESSAADAQRAEAREKYTAFWREFLDKLAIEDGRPTPSPAKSTNLYFMMGKGTDMWISTYLEQSKDAAGVYLRVPHSELGDRIWQTLLADRVAIESAIGSELEWNEGADEERRAVSLRRKFKGPLLSSARKDLISWLRPHTERFLAVLQPRIERLLGDGR